MSSFHGITAIHTSRPYHTLPHGSPRRRGQCAYQGVYPSFARPQPQPQAPMTTHRMAAQERASTCTRPIESLERLSMQRNGIPSKMSSPHQKCRLAATQSQLTEPRHAKGFIKEQCGTVSPSNKGLVFDKKSASMSPDGQTRLMWKK